MNLKLERIDYYENKKVIVKNKTVNTERNYRVHNITYYKGFRKNKNYTHFLVHLCLDNVEFLY